MKNLSPLSDCLPRDNRLDCVEQIVRTMRVYGVSGFWNLVLPRPE